MDEKIIKSLLEKENPTVLEIGSNVGGDTKKFLKAFRDINIYCFEPDPRCIKKFKKNIKDNRCTLIEAAVGNNDGKAILHLSGGINPVSIPRKIRALHLTRPYALLTGKDWLESSSIVVSLTHSKQYPWLTFKKEVEVKTMKLDTFVKKNNIHFIDFIWSDVQGAEKDMISGAVNMLNFVKYFYMEYGEISVYPQAMTRNETIELMRKYNFELIPEYSSERERGNLLFRNRGLA